MFVNEPTVRVRAALLAALLACSACGGGGGGGGAVVGGGGGTSPPPGPGTPATTVVTARAVASAPSAQEGQPFKLDASTSSAQSGGALTYAWTQVSGPAVAIAMPAGAMLDLNAPEVTADAKAEFRVTVTSGATSSTANVEMTFANIAQTPVFIELEHAANVLFDAPFGGSIATIAGSWTDALVGISTAAGGPITFIAFEVNNSPPRLGAQPFTRTFSQPSTFVMSPGLLLNGAVNPSRVSMTEEKENRFATYAKQADGTYGEPSQEVAITRPCTLEYTFVGAGPSPSPRPVIGQREHGLTVLSDNGAVIQEIKSGQSLCALTPVRAPINSTAGSFIGPDPTIWDIVAIDTAANTINHFGGSTSDPNLYELKSQAALQLDSSSPLRFVAAKRIWATNEYGSWRGVSGLALVYTDDRHQGEHRLVLAGLDGNRVIRQITRSWTLGVPSDVILDDLDGDDAPEVIVISSTSPQAMVFEMNRNNTRTIPFTIPMTPSFVEIGLGATQALPTYSNVLTLDGMFIAYRDKRIVNLFYPVR